jgi:hypothetical protein
MVDETVDGGKHDSVIRKDAGPFGKRLICCDQQ